jgi:hypothetical protein
MKITLRGKVWYVLDFQVKVNKARFLPLKARLVIIFDNILQDFD